MNEEIGNELKMNRKVDKGTSDNSEKQTRIHTFFKFNFYFKFFV